MMSQPPDNHREGISPHGLDEQSQQSMKALGTVLETLTPWLFEFGNWIFGGLIAFNLLIIASLLTVGPTDPAILVSIATFACALPLNVTGLFMLKLTKDMKDIAIDDLVEQAFKDVEFPNADAYFPAGKDRKIWTSKRTEVTLRYSVGIAAISIVLSLIGMVAALWY